MLTGCNVDTMMHYLKSLGVFKILATQKNPDINASWNDSNFCLHVQSQKNSEELKKELVEFLCNEYKPTPIVTPWNGGGGFVAAKEKKSKKGKKANNTLGKVEKSTDSRLKEYGSVIEETRRVLQLIRHDGKEIVNKNGEINVPISDDIKQQILQACRNYLPDKVVPTLDAMYVITKKPKYNPVLGSGGNDGNLEFIDNFRQNLIMVFDESQKDVSRRWIGGTLFDDNVQMEKSAIGQFNPGCMFGPNMTNTDISGTSLINPWDYILMIEGAILFAGGITKHLSSESTNKASFPFTVDATNAGYSTSGGNEKSRGEIWVPTWERPASLGEIQHVFGESRAQLGKRQAANGADFARAIIGLGMERGITKFYRFGILERNGKSHIMMPMGSIIVRKHVNGEVLFELDPWMEKIRHMKNKPSTIESNLRTLENAIFDFTAHGGSDRPEFLQKILIAVGKLELALSISLAGKNDPSMPHPIPKLSNKWISQCYDDTPEFRLAASLASIRSGSNINAVRANIETVELQKNKKVSWATHNNSVIPIKSPYEKYLSAILNRRMIDTIKSDGKYAPTDGSISAPLPDVMKFLYGSLDFKKIIDLFIPLSFIRYDSEVDTPWKNQRKVWEDSKAIPHVFAALKMVFLPHEYETKHIRLEPSILPLLYANRISDAFSVAQNRLLYSGFRPILYARDNASVNINIPSRIIQNLTAALLFPLEKKSEDILASLIFHEE